MSMAKMASSVREAVEHFKSAPKEAIELVERLNMLETACELIRFHLERRHTLPECSSPASLGIITKALAQCHTRMESLAKMMSSLSLGSSHERPRVSTSDTVARLRLVLRKDRMRSMTADIDHIISLLQFIINVDMCGGQFVVPSSAPETASVDTSAAISSSQLSAVLSTQSTTDKQRHTSRYLGHITWTTVEIIDKDSKTKSVPHRKGLVTIRLPFTAMQLDLHYNCGMGTPSYALNVTHVIDYTTELGEQLSDLMIDQSDPKELHRLISERQLSLYSLYRMHNRETNLFFWSVDGLKDANTYFSTTSATISFKTSETPPQLFSIHSNFSSSRPCEVTETLLSARPYDMRATDIQYLIDTSNNPGYFNRYLRVFLKSQMINHSDLLFYAWRRLVSAVSSELPVDYDVFSWIPAFQYLIEQGIDIHKSFNGRVSAYTSILDAPHPFDADDRAHSWLKILKECGVDIKSYIQRETEHIEKIGLGLSHPTEDSKVVWLEFEGLTIPSWRREVTMESKAVEVLEEFQNFGLESIERQLYGLYPSGPDDFKQWKVYGQGEDWRAKCFPFLLAPIDCMFGVTDLRLRDLWCRETHHRAVKLRDERSERRQTRKWNKIHKGRRVPSKQMPGTWVD
ncbi:hypothetical protein N8I77_008305 [Diaporthe amygdali]|uniref:Uncharacterized protein n=1 Tax=Phomopsis amygdali TaxID=1214568 RepID=A0AAD9SG68_PHOAM|nr:hypothetical protein N8I77_008305 [Diaporthe amygdali]